jgi:hypothetical protein
VQTSVLTCVSLPAQQQVAELQALLDLAQKNEERAQKQLDIERRKNRALVSAQQRMTCQHLVPPPSFDVTLMQASLFHSVIAMVHLGTPQSRLRPLRRARTKPCARTSTAHPALFPSMSSERTRHRTCFSLKVVDM